MVLDTPEREPELCLGGVADSLPPQCDGIPIARWDWGTVDGEDAASGTMWGTYHLLGSYDGETFTVHDAGPPQFEDEGDSDPIDTPCPEPAEGWKAADPGRASHEDVVRAQREVSRETNFAGLWIDYYNEPPGGFTEEDPGDIILNVAFTGDLIRHEEELDDLWGGPLCITEHTHPLEKLEEIQNGFPYKEFDVAMLGSSINVVTGTVEIAVIEIDPDTLQEIDERYGDAVQVTPRLKPASHP